MSRLQFRLEALLIALGVLFYLFVFPHGIHGDGFVRYEALLQLLESGSWKPMIYSYVGPLASAPLLLPGELVKDGYWWVSRFNVFVFLGSAWVLARTFREEWGREGASTFLLLLFCATMFPRHTADYYSEVFSSCLTALSLLAFVKGRFTAGAASLLLAAWNTPGTALGASLVALLFFFREARFRYLLLPPLIAAGILGENWLKFGALFPDAYLGFQGEGNLLPYSKGPGFSYPLFFGLLSVFLSFGKGLFFFSPGLMAGFVKGIFRGPSGAFLMAGLFYLLGLVLVYSRWWAWSGDWFWGPRFYLFASLWAVVALAKMKTEGLLAGRRLYFWVFAVALSLWVGFQGITFGTDFLEACQGEVGFLCQYVPEFSALWRPFVSDARIEGRKVAFLVYFALVALALLREPVWALARISALACSAFAAELRQRAWRF